MRRTQKEGGNTKSRFQLPLSGSSKSLPNAHKSSVSSITVLPEPTESNCPIIDRSSVRRCRFENLSPESCVSRSSLSSVTITGGDEHSSSPMVESKSASIDGSGSNSHSAITRSSLVSCSVSASSIDRSSVSHCTVSNARNISRSRVSKAHIHGASLIERSSVTSGAQVVEESSLTSSEVRDGSVVCGGSTVADSTICGGSVIRNSKIENSKIEACEIVGCDIRGGKFEGMILRGGVWKGGDLVGRREDAQGEVVIMTKEERERRMEQERKAQMAEQEVGEIQVSISIIVPTRTHDDCCALPGSSYSEFVYPDRPTRYGSYSHDINAGNAGHAHTSTFGHTAPRLIVQRASLPLYFV